jgi:hypothetical protein
VPAGVRDDDVVPDRVRDRGRQDGEPLRRDEPRLLRTAVHDPGLAGADLADLRRQVRREEDEPRVRGVGDEEVAGRQRRRLRREAQLRGLGGDVRAPAVRGGSGPGRSAPRSRCSRTTRLDGVAEAGRVAGAGHVRRRPPAGSTSTNVGWLETSYAAHVSQSASSSTGWPMP